MGCAGVGLACVVHGSQLRCLFAVSARPHTAYSPRVYPILGGGESSCYAGSVPTSGGPRSDNTLKACNYDIGAWKAPGCPRKGLHRGASSTMVVRAIVVPRRIFAVASPTLSRWPPSPFLRKNVTVL